MKKNQYIQYIGKKIGIFFCDNISEIDALCLCGHGEKINPRASLEARALYRFNFLIVYTDIYIPWTI